jgi:hypothetical protein
MPRVVGQQLKVAIFLEVRALLSIKHSLLSKARSRSTALKEATCF